MTTLTFDAKRSEDFAGRLGEVLNDAGLAVMISIGQPDRSLRHARASG